MLCQHTHTNQTQEGGVRFLHSPIVFPDADQDVIGCEVLVPGRVEDAVSCSQDPFVAEQTGSTQQLLRVPLEEHHLPAR